jgi:ArsR family transcriptional regulator
VKNFAERFKAVGDGTRLKILWLLSMAKGDLCVCEIMDTVEDSHCNVSRHLKILKQAGFVRENRQGKWVYFGLTPPEDPFRNSVLQAVLSIPEEKFFNDARRLRLRLSLRENNKCVNGLQSEKWAKILGALPEKNPN